MITALQDVKFFNAFKPIQNLSRTFEVPVCSFKFSGKDDQEIRDIKGMGLMEDVSSKNIYVGTPPVSYLARLQVFKPEDDRIRPGFVSSDGFFAWSFLMKGVQIFSTIAALTATDEPIAFAYTNASKRVDATETSTLPTVDGDMTLESVTNTSTLARIEAPNMYAFAPPAVGDKSSMPGSFIDIRNLPTKFPKGIFFPQFPGMNTSDPITAHHTFERIFRNLLGTNGDNTAAILSKIRSGCKQLAFSRTGVVLSHIYRGMDIASQVPRSGFTIILDNNVYKGFVVTGEFTISLYGKKVECDDVLEDLKTINKHESDAESVAVALNAARDAGGNSVYNFSKHTFLKSRSALVAFMSVDKGLFTSTETIDDVIKTLSGMNYGDSFPIPTAQNIAECTTAMAIGSLSGLAAYPAYLSDTVLRSNSRVMAALCMYGPKAPSFNRGGDKGIRFSIPGPQTSVDPNLEVSNGKRVLQYLPFKMVTLNVAMSEWTAAITKGYFTFDQPRKGKKEFTNLQTVIVTLSTDPQFSEVYSGLKSMVNSARALAQGGKRKHDGGGEDRDAKKRRGLGDAEMEL